MAPQRLHFEARETTEAEPSFVAQGLEYTVAVGRAGATVVLGGRHGRTALTMRVPEAWGTARVSGEAELPAVTRRYVGLAEAWSASRTFERVKVASVRPGLDLLFYGRDGSLEYDFIVHPGADPSDARLVIDGADAVHLTPLGELEIEAGGQVLRQRRPIAYQWVDGRKQSVPVEFAYDATTRQVAFTLGAYDRSRVLVIDPVLVYSSYFGGTSEEQFLDVSLGPDGAIYALGASLDNTGYPTTAGTMQPAKPGPAGTSDYVVTKFDPSGQSVVWSTFLGGTANDFFNSFNRPAALAVDATGAVHVTGETQSTDFPVTPDAADGTFNGGFDAFYVRLTPTGTLAYGTYLGGTGTERGFGIAVDSARNAYLIGSTTSANFPTTASAYRTTPVGSQDLFVTKFSPAGALTYSTYFGGTSFEATYSGDIVVDGSGRVTFASDTLSSNAPVTAASARQLTNGGDIDLLVARLDTLASGAPGLLYSSYLGGTGVDAVYGMATSPSGRVLLAGLTRSSNFPVTAGAYTTPFNASGYADAYVVAFDPSQSGAASLPLSSRWGGNEEDALDDIAIDSLGRAHVVGITRSDNYPFVGAVDTFRNLTEPIVSILDATGSTLVFSSYLGARSNNQAFYAVATNPAGETFVAGKTNDNTVQGPGNPNGFLLVNAIQGTYGGGDTDAVLQKLGFAIDLSITKTASAATVLPGANVTFTITVNNPSSDPASGVVVTDALPPGLEYVSCTAGAGGTCGGSGQNRTITFASVAPGTTATAQLVARLVAVTPGQSVPNTATVSAGVLDPVSANNTATAAVSVPTLEPSGDADGDGLSNGFEARFGLDPFGGAGSGTNDDPDGDGRTNLQESQDGTHPRGFVITYLAEGATGAFFDTRLAIANPTASPALVLTRFQRPDGSTVTDYRVVPAMSRATIDVETVPGLESAAFSTLIEADVQVVADRTMTWDGNGYGSHAERGILTRTATTWYFAEGATFGQFNLFYLIQNPNAQAATVRVTYLRPAPAAPLVKTYIVGPQSRFNIWVDDEGSTDPALAPLAAAELSAIIESTNGVPIIAERAMYLDQPGRPLGAGHESAGVTAPATEWFLAEGATGAYFDLFLLIANPGTTTADVRVDYLLSSGQVLTRTYTVAGQSRFNIWVDQQDPLLADAAMSSRVVSTNGVPIIVERAMWWPGPTPATWQEAHNSPGEVVTGTRWAVAEGESGGPRDTETYVLVANVSPSAGTIKATVLFEDGTPPVSATFPIGPSTRMNIVPATDFPQTVGKRYGVIVESIGGSPVQIVVERAMYSDAGGIQWAAGSNALATRLP